MSKTLASDYLLKTVAGLFLALLVYQGKCLCDRIDKLERNQVRIMVCLGIEPVSWENLPKGGHIAHAARIQRNQGGGENAEKFKKKPLTP